MQNAQTVVRISKFFCSIAHYF